MQASHGCPERAGQVLAYMERTVRAVLEKAASGAEGDVEGVQRELSKYGFRCAHVYQ